MPKLNPLALSVICALSIGGCASSVTKNAEESPAVRPMLSANNAAVTGEAMYRLGRYFEGQARYEQAIAAYREALKRDPLLVEAYTGLGMSLAVQKRYEDAIRQFQAAVVLAPTAAHAHNNLGYAYLLSGMNEQAVKALEEATRLEPTHEKSRENLRVAQSRLGVVAVQPESQPSAAAGIQVLAEPFAGISLVAVAPQVFELRTTAREREARRLEAVLLDALPQQKPAIKSARNFRVEVSNGNGVLGLAQRVAGRLVSAGVKTTRLTNQRPFQQARTEVQYREGYAAEAAAVAANFQHSVQIVPRRDLASHVDVRVLLGRDVKNETAMLTPRPTDKTFAATGWRIDGKR